jgi:ABC-type transporter Mla subunit MlaD
MPRSVHHWRLGLFVVASASAGFLALLWLAGGRVIPGRGDTIPAVSYFDESLYGLDRGSAVRFRGIKIGRVNDMAIAPDGRLVEVHMTLDGPSIASIGVGGGGSEGVERLERAVTQGLRVRLTSQGLTGVKVVEASLVDPSREPPPKLAFQPPRGYVPPARSTLDKVEETVLEVRDRLPATWDRVDGVLERTERVADRLDRELDALRASKVPEKLAAVLDESRAGIADAREPLVRALEGIQRASDALAKQANAAKVGETTASAREAMDSIGELARRATPVADELRETVVELRDAAARVRELADLLERDPGALVHGKAVRDDKGGRK